MLRFKSVVCGTNNYYNVDLYILGRKKMFFFLIYVSRKILAFSRVYK